MVTCVSVSIGLTWSQSPESGTVTTSHGTCGQGAMAREESLLQTASIIVWMYGHSLFSYTIKDSNVSVSESE